MFHSGKINAGITNHGHPRQAEQALNLQSEVFRFPAQHPIWGGSCWENVATTESYLVHCRIWPSYPTAPVHSPYTTPPLAVPADTAPQELVAAIDGQSATLAAAAWTKSDLDDPGKTPQVAETADDKQEWEICDIAGKEDVHGVPHYWVQWSATLVPKFDMWNARALVARFEARLRAQSRQSGGRGQGRRHPSKAGEQTVTEARSTGETQQKKGRGRPRRQV
jgi:hypothetical protein